MKLVASSPYSVEYLTQNIAGGDIAAFPVKGQGTVSVIPASATPFTMTLRAKDGPSFEVSLVIDQGGIRLLYNGEQIAQKLHIGLDSKVIQPYWLSLDSNNRRIRYGKGEMLRTLMLFEYSWADPSVRPLDTAGLDMIQVTGAYVEKFEILAIPVNLDPSPYIVPANAVTLEGLAYNSISVIADLPQACQRLYANVASEGMSLRPHDFRDFPEAIQHSIVTPGALCYNRLAEKDPLFGYLRVTIDSNLGDSPGQPYVLEIWPAGNGSPIHNHGEACAIIKVLYGQIEVSWFAALNPAISTPWGKVVLKSGEVTFITPDYYQIHRLFNPLPKGGTFCATIQSYRYADSDIRHYEYFDYIETGQIRHFDPDSDWSYLEFKELIRAEWHKARREPAEPIDMESL